MSNADVGLSMIAALAMRKLRIHMKPIATAIQTSQTSLMRLAPTEDLGVPATLAMEGLLFS